MIEAIVLLTLAQAAARPPLPRPATPPDAVAHPAARAKPAQPARAKPRFTPKRTPMDFVITCNPGNRIACEQGRIPCTPCPPIGSASADDPPPEPKYKPWSQRMNRYNVLRDDKGYERKFYAGPRKGAKPPRRCIGPTEMANACIWVPLYGITQGPGPGEFEKLRKLREGCVDCDPRHPDETLDEAYKRIFHSVITPWEVSKLIQRVTRWDAPPVRFQKKPEDGTP